MPTHALPPTRSRPNFHHNLISPGARTPLSFSSDPATWLGIQMTRHLSSYSSRKRRSGSLDHNHIYICAGLVRSVRDHARRGLLEYHLVGHSHFYYSHFFLLHSCSELRHTRYRITLHQSARSFMSVHSAAWSDVTTCQFADIEMKCGRDDRLVCTWQGPNRLCAAS